MSEFHETEFEARLGFNEKLKTLQTSAYEVQVNFLTAEIEEFRAAGIKEEELEIYKQARLKQIREGSAAHSINLAGAMGKALETAFDPGMGAGEAFKGFILQYLQMIQQAIIATGALNKAIHINIPESIIHKDGPSAGLPFIIGIMAELISNKIPSDCAFTGEISLQGKILPVGGIKEKVTAAYINGMKTVYIPKNNSYEFRNLIPQVKSGLRINLIDHYEDVIEDLWKI